MSQPKPVRYKDTLTLIKTVSRKPVPSKPTIAPKPVKKPPPTPIRVDASAALIDDNFTVFDEEMLEFFGDAQTIQNIRARIIEDTPATDVECPHIRCFDADGINICKECGCEVEKLDFQPEWRWYGATDNRISKDPSRCHRSKDSVRGGIEKVFIDAKLSYLSLAIRKKTEMKYKKIVGGETVRGKGRKSIVAACLLFTFRDEGDVRTSDEIRIMFGLTKQEMSDGLTKYHAAFPEDRVQHIKPSDLIRRIMHLTKIDFSHYKFVLRMARCLDKVDYTLNHSSPQSVASAIVYLYLCLTPEVKENLGFTKTKFAREVQLSDITISKLVKRAAEIIGLPQNQDL